MALGSSPALSRMRVRSLWFNEGKNCEMSKARVLVVFLLVYPDQIIYVSAMPASEVDLNFKPPS